VEINTSKYGSKINPQIKYWIAYSNILELGPVNFLKIVNHFQDMEIAWTASPTELKRVGLDEKMIGLIISARLKINPDIEIQKLDKANVWASLITDDSYPKPLKEIVNPPPVLYYRGSLNHLNNHCLAIVGTRKFSLYGKQAVEQITRELSGHGITIVSGLALGIDALAHAACLSTGGQTIAVLGSAVNKECTYPSSNRHLAEKIIDSGGAIVSEYPIGTEPNKFTFPMRNRIISGLSSGVLVIEAPKSSGSLITAKHALEQNRDIYAVPGNIYNANSSGTNHLIDQGAKLITSSQDILEELNIQLTLKGIIDRPKTANNEELEILKILTNTPLHIDKIKVSSKLNINVLSSLLTKMEIKGLVKDIGGKNYILI
jgi:DNA processing protein